MSILSSALIIARRDFTAIVLTPTFLLFLLAPLMMVVFAGIGGVSAGQLVQSSASRERIVAVVPSAQVPAFAALDARFRPLFGPGAPPQLLVVDAARQTEADLVALRVNADVQALLTGAATSPVIAERSRSSRAGRYLAQLAETMAREGTDSVARAEARTTPAFDLLPAAGPARASQSRLGYLIVIGLFMITLLLGSQTVGVLAEEKSNKVIEILAAAAPLEGVFLGKLFGMLGVALLFISFWGILIGSGLLLAGGASNAALAGMLGALTPAVGWPAFILLAAIYFFSAFLLLGAVFLGVGAQATTVREIQMLSLPITLLQLGMFTLATAAANSPGSSLAVVAEWLPWSSPFAMAARAASDANMWPHALAILWQLLWIALTIGIGVRLFRAGVLRSGGLRMALFGRSRTAA